MKMYLFQREKRHPKEVQRVEGILDLLLNLVAESINIKIENLYRSKYIAKIRGYQAGPI